MSVQRSSRTPREGVRLRTANELGLVDQEQRDAFWRIENAHSTLQPKPWQRGYVAGRVSTAELRILRAARLGYSDSETADLFRLSVHTVRAQRRSMQQKLGASNLAHALWIAVEHDLLEGPEGSLR